MRTEQLPAGIGPEIVYSHYESRQLSGEQCAAEHGLTYLLAGSLRVTDAGASQTFEAGSLLFSRKNFLAKFTKQPAEDGPFRAITVVFGRAMLLEYSQQHVVRSEPPAPAMAAVMPLAINASLNQYFETLRPYFEVPLPAPLARHQQQEALRLLLWRSQRCKWCCSISGSPAKSTWRPSCASTSASTWS